MPANPNAKTVYFGNPASPTHQPPRTDIVRLFDQIEAMIGAGAIKGFAATVAALPASGNIAGDSRIVINADMDVAGVYTWIGSAWARVAGLPTIFTTDEWAVLSQAWAANPEDVAVSGGLFSALHYAAKAAADRVLAQAAAGTSTAQAVISTAQAAASLASATAAALAALAAGAPIVMALTDPEPADGTVELLKLDAGLQVHEVVAGAWVLRGWLVGPKFEPYTALFSDTSSTFGPDGTVVEYGPHRAVVDSTLSVSQVTHAGGVKLKLLPGPDGTYNVKGLSDDPDTAFSRLFPGDWIVSEDIALTGDVDGKVVVELEDFRLSTVRGAEITVGSGSGELAIHGNRSAPGKLLRVNGRVRLFGKDQNNRTVGNVCGRLEVVNSSEGFGIIFGWASNPVVTDPWDVHLIRDGGGNNGVAFTILKDVDLAGGVVRGKVSLGYSYTGNGTVAEPTIDRGRIGPMLTLKDDDYTGVGAGDHGHYAKGCRDVTFDGIRVVGNGANAWSGGQYHIKLRDNENCVFNRPDAADSSDDDGLGRIFVTSDANALAMNENKDNKYRDVRGKFVCFLSGSGVNKDCTVENIYGLLSIAETSVTGWKLKGEVVFPDAALSAFENFYTFQNADVTAPAMAGTAYFNKPLKAEYTTFNQQAKTRNRDIDLLFDCLIKGDLRINTTTGGPYTANISQSRGTARFVAETASGREVVANIDNSNFATNEPGGTGSPTTRNYNFTRMGSEVWISSGAAKADSLKIRDGVATPATDAAYASIYVASGDGDMKGKFGDGFVGVILADS